jgi:NAD(P)-dependent dehydrogenase (short-subunit alcohol dehydrogenase family)
VKLQGKIAVVSGGARGIRRALAVRYVAEGAIVAIAELDATGRRSRRRST